MSKQYGPEQVEKAAAALSEFIHPGLWPAAGQSWRGKMRLMAVTALAAAGFELAEDEVVTR